MSGHVIATATAEKNAAAAQADPRDRRPELIIA
jgi:hypothetical protein